MSVSIAETIAGIREALVESGIPEFSTPLPLRDQSQAAFRADLVSLGIDSAEEGQIEAALAGMVIGLKVNIQQNLPLALISQYLGLCEVVLELLDGGYVDMADMPDLSFLGTLPLPAPPPVEVAEETPCPCGNPHGVVPLPSGGRICIDCASAAVHGGMIAIRLTGAPQVGGPDFNRVDPPEPMWTEEMIRAARPKSWRELTISDLFTRRGKHKRRSS